MLDKREFIAHMWFRYLLPEDKARTKWQRLKEDPDHHREHDGKTLRLACEQPKEYHHDDRTIHKREQQLENSQMTPAQATQNMRRMQDQPWQNQHLVAAGGDMFLLRVASNDMMSKKGTIMKKLNTTSIKRGCTQNTKL